MREPLGRTGGKISNHQSTLFIVRVNMAMKARQNVPNRSGATSEK